MEKPSRPALILLILALIIVSALSFYRIGVESMWGDEQNGIRIAKLDLWSIIKGQDATHPPGYHVIMHWWVGLFGDGDVAVRSFSAIFAIASIPAIFFLARRLFTDTEAAISALLLSVTQFFILFAQEARPYTFIVFIGIIATHLFLRVLSERKADWRYWSVAVLGLYVHYFFIFIVFVHCIVLLLARLPGVDLRGRAVLFATVMGPVGAAFSVWAVYRFIPSFLIRNPSVNLIAWIEKPQTSTIASLLQSLTGTASLPILAFSLAGLSVIALFSLPILLQFARHRRVDFGEFGAELFVGAMVFLPLIVAFAISQVRPIFIARYMIIILPFMVIFLARSIANLKWRAAMAVAVCAFAILNVAGLAQAYDQPDFEDWRSATRFLLDNYREGDVIVLYKLPPFLTTYYVPHGVNFSQQIIGDISDAQRRDAERENMARYVAGKNRAFLLYTYEYVPDIDIEGVAVIDELLAEAAPGFEFVQRNESFRIVIDVYERPLIIGGERIDARSVVSISAEEFSGRVGARFEGIVPFYGRDDSAHVERDIPSGNYVLAMEVRGDPPGPVPLDYRINGREGVITIDGNVSSWRELDFPMVVEYGRFELELTFRNDTYVESGGVVVADNAAYVRNVRLIRLGGDAR